MIDDDRLDGLLAQPEGQYLEFKQSPSDSLGKSICGFANSTGGTIIVGARPGGLIMGIGDPSVEGAKVENIARTCRPPAMIVLSHFRRDGRDLLVVEVPRSERELLQFGSGFYTRAGPMTQAMDRTELEKYFWTAGLVRFEDKPCDGCRYPTDFDGSAFRMFLMKSGISPPRNRADMLVNLGLARRVDGSIMFNNAGVLFFSREPARLIRHCPVDCILFGGRDRVDIRTARRSLGTSWKMSMMPWHSCKRTSASVTR